jgi:hypothetical protein
MRIIILALSLGLWSTALTLVAFQARHTAIKTAAAIGAYITCIFALGFTIRVVIESLNSNQVLGLLASSSVLAVAFGIWMKAKPVQLVLYWAGWIIIAFIIGYSVATL